jgi:hypothetical protein
MKEKEYTNTWELLHPGVTAGLRGTACCLKTAPDRRRNAGSKFL